MGSNPTPSAMEIQLSDDSRDKLEAMARLFDRSHSDVLDLSIAVLAAIAFSLHEGSSIIVNVDDDGKVTWEPIGVSKTP